MATRKYKTILRLILCVVLLFGFVPEAYATETTNEGVCEHHKEHSEDCGYSQGSTCTHVHTDACYEEVVTWLCGSGESNEPTSTTEHIHNENCQTEMIRMLNCKHVHDEQCGYAEAVPCGYVCETCDTQSDMSHTQVILTEGVQAVNEALPSTRAIAEDDVASVNGVGYSTLSEAYAEAVKDGSTIVLEQGITDCTYLTVTGTVTVDLNGYSITARSGNFVFYVLEGGNLTLTGEGNINGGDYAYGIIWNKGILNLEDNVVLQDNTATGWGGAIYNQGTFTMNGGSIKNTTAAYGGGAIYSTGTFEMSGGHITNCKTTNGYGGAVYSTGTVAMSGGTISRCETQKGGGGVHLEKGSFTMKDGIIEHCKVTSSVFNWNQDKASNGGGGVSVRTSATFDMQDGLIWKNASSGGDGGGGVSNDGTFTLSGGQIIMNDATNGEGFSDYGGGVINDGQMTMSNGMIANNIGQSGIWSANQDTQITITGGAIFGNYALSLFGNPPSEDNKKVDLVLNTNHWTNNGANILAVSDMAADGIYGYDFTKWFYIGEGWDHVDRFVRTEVDGALPSDLVTYNEENTHVFFRTMYESPETAEKEGIYLNGIIGNDEKDGTSAANAVRTFEKAWELAKAELDAGKETATIYVCGKMEIIDAKTWGDETASNIIVKRADGYTGALAEVGTSGQLTLRNITIDGNKGTDYTDSLIHVKGGNLLIQDGTILQNNLAGRAKKGYDGGAVFIERGSGEMTGGTIQNNTARNNGGGVSVSSGTFTMSAGTIQNNTAIYGGGICAVRGADVELSGSAIISNNNASHGGGVNIGAYSISECYAGHEDHNQQTLTMSGGTISDNHANTTGGAIFIQMNSTATISEGYITGNQVDDGKSPYQGGAIYVNGGRGSSWNQIDPSSLDEIEIIPNGLLQLYNAEISGNQAEEYGGALAGCPTADIKVYVTDGAVMYNNKTETGSGLDVYVAEKQVGTTDSYVSDFMLGGGMYQWFWRDPDDGIRAEQSQYQNTAGEIVLSGAVAKEDVDKALTLAKVHITENKALYGRGGGIAANGNVVIGIPEETSAEITISKAWDDMENKFNTRPTTIKLDIRYGEYTLRGIELTADHNWETTLRNMPSDILKQTSPSISVLEYDGEPYTLGDVKADIQGDTLIISMNNTYTHPTGNLTVSKTISGDGADIDKAFTFTVTLDDTSISGIYGDMTFKDGIATFALKGGESKTATGLWADIEYTIAESDNEGYTVTSTGSVGTIEANQTAEASFDNHKDRPDIPPSVPPTGDHSQISIWLSLLLASGGLSFLLYRKRAKITV